MIVFKDFLKKTLKKSATREKQPWETDARQIRPQKTTYIFVINEFQENLIETELQDVYEHIYTEFDLAKCIFESFRDT